MAFSEINTMICQTWCQCPLFKRFEDRHTERQPLIKVDDEALLYSEESGVFTKEVPRETDAEKRYRYGCILLTYFATFTVFLQSSLYWASLWPYLSQIDPTTPESFFGIVVSAYSFGSVISAPLLGYWSSVCGSTRWPILAGYFINLIGNFLMAFVEAFPVSQRRWVMLAARLIAGIGSGNRAVQRAFLALASYPDELNLSMTFLATAVSCGTLLGTGFSASLSPIGYPALVLGHFHLDMYSAEAYLAIALTLVCVVLYIGPYKEYDVASCGEPTSQTRQPRTSTVCRDESMDKEANSADLAEEHPLLNVAKDGEEPVVDTRVVITCIVIRFVMLFCLVFDDTIGSPFTMAMFGWDRGQAILYNGIIQGMSGAIDFCGNIFVGAYLLNFVNERSTIIFGLPAFAMFYVISFSYPGLPPTDLGPMFYSNISDLNSTINLSNVSTAMGNLASNLTVIPFGGCNHDWCAFTTKIYIVQYVIAYVFLTIAFCTAFIPTSTLFTKLLGPKRQGTWQGFFSSAGSLAMTISPVIISSIFQHYGPRVAWSIGFGLLMFATLLVLVNWNRMLVELPTTNVETNSTARRKRRDSLYLAHHTSHPRKRISSMHVSRNEREPPFERLNRSYDAGHPLPVRRTTQAADKRKVSWDIRIEQPINGPTERSANGEQNRSDEIDTRRDYGRSRDSGPGPVNV